MPLPGLVARQSINQKMVDRTEISGNTLNAALTGVPDDAVLFFNAAGTIIGNGLAQSNVAGTGSTFTISRPGWYRAELIGSQSGAVTVDWGISLDVAAAGLVGDPTLATAGMLTVRRDTSLAASVVGIYLGVTFLVREVAAAGAATGVVRFHATNGAGAAPAGIVVVADVSYRLTMINEFAG